MRGGPSLKVKGGLVGFRKDSFEEERLHPPPSEEEGAWGKRWSSLWKGFLSPTRGTEGVVKTIDKEGFEKTAPSRAVSSSSLRFLSPTRGTEGVVKTIEEDRDERWTLP